MVRAEANGAQPCSFRGSCKCSLHGKRKVMIMDQVKLCSTTSDFPLLLYIRYYVQTVYKKLGGVSGMNQNQNHKKTRGTVVYLDIKRY